MQLKPTFGVFAIAAAAAASFSARADIFADIWANDIDLVRSALEADPDVVNGVNDADMTPLAYAVSRRRLEAAFELLAAGADPDAATSDRKITALHRAADKGDADFVRLLLENKASPDLASSTGFTALHFAARTNSLECVRLLVAAGANVDAADVNGRTPLHIAASHDAVEAATALVAAGASTKVADKFGYLPAALASDADLVEALGGVPVPPQPPVAAQARDDVFFPPSGAAAFPVEPPAPESAEAPVVMGWDENPFHDDSLDPSLRIRRFHADPGTRLYPDGRSYWGGLKRDKFEGWGVLLAANERDRYEGMFHRGKKDGEGTYYYANGDVFAGNFADDAPSGEGEYRFAGGGSVTGTWKRGVFWQGRGTFTVASGAKFAGTWDNGELVASRPID